jgi:hypothetical protein
MRRLECDDFLDRCDRRTMALGGMRAMLRRTKDFPERTTRYLEAVDIPVFATRQNSRIGSIDKRVPKPEEFAPSRPHFPGKGVSVLTKHPSPPHNHHGTRFASRSF